MKTKAKNVISILLCFTLIFTSGSFWSIHAVAVPTEVKGKTVAEVLGMDGATYISWLTSHEKDKYYLGTPYTGYDHRNPNGDCAGAYGTMDSKGVAGMNCTGFVWHALYKATKASGGNTSIIPALGRDLWLNFYRNNKISRKYFSSKSEMLKSGYLNKGDIIWMYADGQETISNDYHHVGIYWGDGRSDVLWHSLVTENAITTVIPASYSNTMYQVLKVGASSSASLDTPQLKTVDAADDGIMITWDAVPGAVKYRVFRYDTLNSKWRKLSDTADVSWTDSAAELTGTYTYTVRCVSYDGTIFTSGYDRNGIIYTYSEPAEPTEEPSEALEPTEAVDPTEIIEPTDMIGPSESIGPSEPTVPDNPVSPTEPTGSEIKLGDVDGDGAITNRDAMILDRYVANWEGYDRIITNIKAADLNGDGEVNNRDAMILDRYVADWEGYDKYLIRSIHKDDYY